MLRGGYRRFPFLFAYVVGDFLTTVVEIPSGMGYQRGIAVGCVCLHQTVFWFDVVVMQVLVYSWS